MSKFCQKMEASKISFFCNFLVFQVFARRFFLDFRGLGPPPGLIFGIFLRYSFFARFFHIFSQKNEKNKKVKTAQNTAPVQRIWLSGVWKKHTQHRKNAFKFSLIFGTFLGSNGRKRRKKTAKARKSLLAPSLGTPFWSRGRFWSIFWARPGPKNGPKPEKIDAVLLFFIASKNNTHKFERRSVPGSHFESPGEGPGSILGLILAIFVDFLDTF